ncbi:hypothetical protein [Sorangium sp. So ce1335]|uniref:hypothetical protein n=1 Tax=Sorangium sp. So ce1335 TaxID=3133335 RepID=UPI003F5F0800
MEPIDAPDIFFLAEDLESTVHGPPTREGEERLFEVSSSVELNPEARPDGAIPILKNIKAKLVARWLVDERGNRFLGWVYAGPADLSRYAEEKSDGERFDTWITRMLARSAMRVRVTERNGDAAMIEAELRATSPNALSSAECAKGAA